MFLLQPTTLGLPQLDVWCSKLRNDSIGVRQNPCLSSMNYAFMRRSLIFQTVRCAAGKGFMTPSETSKLKKEKPSDSAKIRRTKSKGKKFMRPDAPGQQLQQQQQQNTQIPFGVAPVTLDETFRRKSDAIQAGEQDPEVSFQERLKALKIEAQAKKAEMDLQKQSQPSSASILDEDVYENPPALLKTVFGTKDEKEDGTSSGPNQIGIAVASLLLVGIFLLVNSMSDLEYATQGVPAQQEVKLSKETEDALQKVAVDFEAKLKANPDDLEALEGAGVAYAAMGNYKTAEDRLMKLTTKKSDDPEVWRVLAEVRYRMDKNSEAVAAYRTAIARSSAPDFDLLQGLVTALVADSKPSVAADEIKASLSANGGRGGTMDAVELNLLLGKVYSQWKGHVQDSLLVYDSLIRDYPDDFRGYLAKGVVLKSQNRQGDAERMFLQARFLAPADIRPVVERVAKQ